MKNARTNYGARFPSSGVPLLSLNNKLRMWDFAVTYKVRLFPLLHLGANLFVSLSEGRTWVVENEVLDITGRKQTIYELHCEELRNFYY